MGERQTVRLTDAAPFALGAITVTPAARTLATDDRVAMLEPRVMQVLVKLHRHHGEVVGRDALIDACWDGRVVGEDSINRAILKLRRALDEMGGGGVAIETVAKVGYRLSAAATDQARAMAGAATTRRTARRRWIAGAGVLAAVAVAAAGSRLAAPHRNRSPGRVIAVEPLRAAATDAPARRLAQDFAGDLSRAVLGHDDRLEFVDSQEGRDPTAAFRLSGSIASVGDDLHAVVMLKKRAEPEILWSHDYTAPVAKAAGLRQQVGVNVAAVLVCALGTEGVTEQMDVRTVALYLESCTLHAGDHHREQGLLREVIRRAPQFAGAWADLATSLAMTSEDEDGSGAVAIRHQAAAAASRALALDPAAGRAYFARVLLAPGTRNWLVRQRIIAAGLAAQPDCPQLYNVQASNLADIGRVGDSIASNRRAVALDPLFPGKTASLVRALANAGRLNEANDVVHHMEDVWPDSFYTWHARFETAARIGDPREAEALLADPGDPAFDRRQVAGWRTFLRARATPSARNIHGAIDALLAGRARGEVEDDQLVSDFALLGRPQLALAVALRMPPQPERDFWFRAFLRPVRADPRFMIVARRQGLYAVWRATGLWPDFCRDEALSYDCRAPDVGAGAGRPGSQAAQKPGGGK